MCFLCGKSLVNGCKKKTELKGKILLLHCGPYGFWLLLLLFLFLLLILNNAYFKMFGTISKFGSVPTQNFVLKHDSLLISWSNKRSHTWSDRELKIRRKILCIFFKNHLNGFIFCPFTIITEKKIIKFLTINITTQANVISLFSK